MKFKPGDKVMLFYMKSVFGIDFMCVLGTLLDVRREKFSNTKVVKIKAKVSHGLTFSTDMKAIETELSMAVWSMLPYNEETWEKMKTLRAKCLETHNLYMGLKPKSSEKKVL